MDAWKHESSNYIREQEKVIKDEILICETLTSQASF